MSELLNKQSTQQSKMKNKNLVNKKVHLITYTSKWVLTVL